MADLIEKKCGWCGKVFCPTYDYAYALPKGGKPTKYFCKYSCMCAYRDNLNEKRIYKKRMCQDDLPT